MARVTAHRSALLPPYRHTPETPRLIAAITLAAIMFPLAGGTMFFGYRVLYIVMLAIASGWAAENLANAVRMYRQPGSTTHSVLMAVILAMMLPANVDWYVPVVGAAAAVLIGKHVFGGMGHYVWHPALIGRVIVQLFFSNQLQTGQNALLTRSAIFSGDIMQNGPAASWLRFDWFQSANFHHAAVMLPQPLHLLRNFHGLAVTDGSINLGRYITEKLPSLEHCVLGATPGSIGMTSAIAIMVTGLYLIYRGYIRWQMPLIFLAAVYIAALFLPIVVSNPDMQTSQKFIPIFSQHIAVSLTYANYHLFTGGTFLAAFILIADMTSRPLTLKGQACFALAAGLLTMVFRLYAPIAIPACAAILVMNTLTAPIDRVTRPKG